MKKNSKLIIIALVLSFITFYFIADSYAIFESDITVPTETPTAKWLINVNEQNVTGSDSTFIIDNVNWTTSPNVLEGKAAPGLSADFEIVIDPTGTEVSIRYDLTLDFGLITNTEFQLVSIQETSGLNLIRTDKYTYTAVIPLEEIKKGTISNIKANLVWNNNEDNNEVDSTYANPDIGNINIPASIHFTQYFGETISEYIE